MGTPIEETRTNDLKVLLGEEDESSNDEGRNSGDDSDDSEDSTPDEEETDSEETDSEDDESLDDEEDEESDEDESKEEDDEDEDSLDEKAGADFPDRPTYRQLKEYDPKLLKKFPGLRSLFFREKEFTKIYPTVEDAREAYDDLNKLKAGEQRITQADPEDFLEILNEYSPEKERQFIQNFLPSVMKRNRNAFFAITEPVLKRALLAMHNDAKRNGNENLVASAMNTHEWLFGTDKIEEPAKIETQRANQPDPEKEALKKQNEEILTQRHLEFTKGILTEAENKLKVRITKLIPEETPQYLKNAITKDTVEELSRVLRDDPAHRSNMERLQRKARKDNYSAESKDSIKTALLSRAMLALPGILKKIKSEALQGTVLKPKKNVHARANGSNSSTPNRKARLDDDKVKAVKSGRMSELDFLKS